MNIKEQKLAVRISEIRREVERLCAINDLIDIHHVEEYSFLRMNLLRLNAFNDELDSIAIKLDQPDLHIVV